MTFGFFHGRVVKTAEKRLDLIHELILAHHADIDQAKADRQAAIRTASEEITLLEKLKFRS